jgi:hypothetical protein
MATNGGLNIITDGIIFYYDTSNSKSYKGEPTTNYIYHQNPRIDPSYTSYVWTTSGTWQTKHPNAIRVYNNNGSEITGYVNGGVSDPNNAYHAVWVYDDILKRPVVEMKDFDGSWKAKYIDTGMNAWSTYGYTVGTQYTVSWLQWTSNITRGANVGLYTRNSGNSWNFWDGLITGTNTKINTWERVYVTFTVSSSWDQTLPGNTIYMYGQGSPVATIRIADVQLEIKGHPTSFNNSLIRSNTQGLLPLTTKTSLDLSNVSFNSNGEMIFDGTNDYFDINQNFGTLSQYTIEYVAYSNSGARMPISSRTTTNFYKYGDNSWYYTHGGVGGEFYHSASPTLSGYIHYVITYDGSNVKVWRNNNYAGAKASTGTANFSDGFKIGWWSASGAYAWNGKIPIIKIYNKALTTDEVSKNYNAIKTRFNI